MAVVFSDPDTLGADDPFQTEDRVTAFGSPGVFDYYIGDMHAQVTFDRGTTEVVSLKRIAHA